MKHTGSPDGVEVADPAAGRLMWSLIEVARVLEENLETALGTVGLSSARLSVLTALVDTAEPLPLSELAAKLSCVRSNITQLVDRLEADGLVRRVADPDDRRSVRAEITAAGRERQAAGALHLERVQRDFGVRLREGDRAMLQRVLAGLR
ncbi:MAG TPA: MarR family transcriptional regulator [Gemmatimonadaceae bacterium]|nr:MarR family transcriptional regulator [Gemmatimonadaceae bacterium]